MILQFYDFLPFVLPFDISFPNYYDDFINLAQHFVPLFCAKSLVTLILHELGFPAGVKHSICALRETTKLSFNDVLKTHLCFAGMSNFNEKDKCSKCQYLSIEHHEFY